MCKIGAFAPCLRLQIYVIISTLTNPGWWMVSRIKSKRPIRLGLVALENIGY